MEFRTKWSERWNFHDFHDGDLSHVFWTLRRKFATWKRILFWPVTSKFKNDIGQISVEKIKMTFLRQVQSFNNLFKRLKTKVALFVTVHNDSIFVKCWNIFDQLFDRILEWVNQTDPLEMEFSKFELVFEKLVQVSFSSKLKRDYSNDVVLSHFTDRDWVLMTPSWWGYTV